MTRRVNFIEKGKCVNILCSPMSDSAWCDLNSKGGILELHDLCYNPKCECQKQITFNTYQFQPEGAGYKSTMKKTFK